MSTTFGNASPNPSGPSSTRSSSRLSSTNSKASARATSTFFTPPPTTNNSTFHLPSIVAIILPIVIVLAIVSILFRWWRRRAVARSLATMMQAPAPKIPVQDEGYSLQPQLSAIPSYNQFGSQPQSVPMAVRPAPHPHNFYEGNHGGAWGGAPSSSQMQTPNQHYGQWQNHQPPGGNSAPLVRDDSPRPQTRPSGSNVTYNQLIEESRRVVPVLRPENSSTSAQNWNSGGWTTASSPAPQVQTPQTLTPSNSGQYDHGATTYPPRALVPDQIHPPLLPHSETQPRGTVLLAWTPSIEPIANPSTIGITHPTPPQQPGPSSSTASPIQSPNDSRLHVLRERVQRLETALVEHPQPPHEDDTPDRPPPAYDSRPGSPVSGSTQGIDSTRTTGRAS